MDDQSPQMPPEPQPEPEEHHRLRPAVLILAGLAAAGLAYFLRTYQPPAKSVVRPVLTTETVEVAEPIKEPAAELTPLQKRQQQVQTYINEFAAKQPAPFAIVVEDLKTGLTASTQADHVFKAASLYKSFVAQEIFWLVDNGRVKLNQKVVLKAEAEEPKPAKPKDGKPQPKPKPQTAEVAVCLERMITVSDNPCGRALLLLMLSHGRGSEVNGRFPGTVISGTFPQTSANNVAKLFKEIYRGERLSKTSNQQLLQLHLNQRINNRLPVRLPATYKIAHKTGDLQGVVHDAGIVYSPDRDFILVVMTGPWKISIDQVYPLFSELALKLDQLL